MFLESPGNFWCPESCFVFAFKVKVSEPCKWSLNVCSKAGLESLNSSLSSHISLVQGHLLLKTSPVDSSLRIPGSWTLLDSSVCCIPDSVRKNYPESGLPYIFYMGRIICEIREILYVQKFTYVQLSESSTFASCVNDS